MAYHSAESKLLLRAYQDYQVSHRPSQGAVHTAEDGPERRSVGLWRTGIEMLLLGMA